MVGYSPGQSVALLLEQQVQVQPLQQDLTLDLILLRGGVGERGEQRVDVSQQSTALTEECIVVETWAQRKIKKCY